MADLKIKQDARGDFRSLARIYLVMTFLTHAYVRGGTGDTTVAVPLTLYQKLSYVYS